MTKRHPPTADGEPLLPKHAALVADSGITEDVAATRGYRSVTTRAELKRLGFGDAQCRVPALLLPIRDVSGEIVLYQLRPDEPRVRDGKPLKYETPVRARMTLDVPLHARRWLGDPARPLFVTEGVRKADAAVSHGLCCVAVLGVWNFRGTNEHGGTTALADWEAIALNGRDVYVVFDSDVMTKPAVHAALARLKAFLEHRGARVLLVYLPAGDGGVKVGLDDFLVAGRSIDDLLALASPDLRGLPATHEEPSLPYATTPAGLVWHRPTADGSVPVPLTNFAATVVADVVEDDGAETHRLFELEATLRGRTTQFAVPAAQFAAMGWVSEHLGAGAVVYPGTATKDHAKVAIQLLSGDAPRRRVYAHTGWRHLADGWAYLHGNGAIGADGAIAGVEVALSGSLARFRLPDPPDGAARIAAVRASVALFDLLPFAVAAPLLGAAYVAPLREPLGMETPDLTPWLHGPSGTFKSEELALAQSHFGDFSRQTLPASFAATANAVERLAFAAKDALLAVDDYHPARDQREAQAMGQVAARLLRGVGNGAGRARMRADTSLRPELPPRCVPLVSGERLPEGHSTAARLFPVPVEPGQLTPERLAAAQAKRPLYASAMAAYLQWLAGRLDLLSATLPTRFRALRQVAQRAGAHRREPGQVAHLFLGLEVWLGFAVEVGALAAAEQDALLSRAWTVLVAHAREHGQDLAAETPVRIFLALLGDGFAAKRAYLEAPGGGAPADGKLWGWEPDTRTDRGGLAYHELRHPTTGTLVGVLEDDWVFLYPEATYQFVVAAARMGGQVFPVELRTLLKRLDEAKLIATEPGTGRRTPNVWTGQRSRRVIKLRRDALVPPPPPDGEFGEERKAGAETGLAAPPDTEQSGGHATGSGNGSGEGLCATAVTLSPIPPIPGNSRQGSPTHAPIDEVVEWAM